MCCQVRVRVHKLREPRLYRWPIHLELVHERFAPLITPPQEWESPADLAWAYDQGWTMEEVRGGVWEGCVRPTVPAVAPCCACPVAWGCLEV
jgi:hypothetical protein